MNDSNRSMLIVDDNRELCDTLTDIMEMEGFTVTLAYDGYQALEIAEKQHFNIVLMDVKMPGMNGVETYKKFRKIAPDTPVIMITAFALEDLIKEALREGAFAAMSKPLDFDELFSVITDAQKDDSLVLMIDDEEDVCEAVRDVLVQNGYSVRVALSGEEAVRCAHLSNFDFVLLDMNLPSMTGYETFRKIKEIRPRSTVIIVTGFAFELSSTIQRALNENAYVCVQKPVKMEKFLPMLEAIASKHSMGDFSKPDSPYQE